MELLVGIITGGALSWAIAHWYYRRSSKEVPDWANRTPDWAIPLIEKLPDAPVSQERLIELYNEAVATGELQPHQFTGFLKCPNCGAGQEYFEPYEASDPRYDMHIRGFRCSKCGYELSGDEVQLGHFVAN